MKTPYINDDISDMSNKDLIRYQQRLIDYISQYIDDDKELNEVLEVERELTLREGA